MFLCRQLTSTSPLSSRRLLTLGRDPARTALNIADSLTFDPDSPIASSTYYWIFFSGVTAQELLKFDWYMNTERHLLRRCKWNGCFAAVPCVGPHSTQRAWPLETRVVGRKSRGMFSTTLVSGGHFWASPSNLVKCALQHLSKLSMAGETQTSLKSWLALEWPLETRVVERSPSGMFSTTLVSSVLNNSGFQWPFLSKHTALNQMGSIQLA